MPQQQHEVASIDELPSGGMRDVTVDGTEILLIRDGDRVSAIGATCPHAGAKLSQGVLYQGRIVCPWHKAAFCTRTGALMEPPAVDGLPRYDAKVEGGRIFVTLPAVQPEVTPPVQNGRCFVIVGAGAAGAVAAQTLRQSGFGGRLVMLDRENRVPYDRTYLSKYFLSGEKGAEKSPLQSQAFYRENKIERHTADVTHIDTGARRITCADGSVLDYDSALLASGAAAVRPSFPGAGRPTVFLLRSRVDADAILSRAEQSDRVVVIGASFIGMEVAASLRERGLDVVVVDREDAPFKKQLGPLVGGAFTKLHQDRGVGFRFGRRIESIESGRLMLDGNEAVSADMIVIGAGVRPAVPELAGVSLNEDGGVPVDPSLRVVDGLYAAGDVASFPLRGDGEPIRVEHWRVAQQHGRLAALNMLGGTGQYDAVPVFWTIQYMKRLDYVGHAKSWDDVVVHGDLSKPEFLAYYIKEGRVVAAVGMDRDKDMASLITLMTEQRDWSADALGPNPAALLRA